MKNMALKLKLELSALLCFIGIIALVCPISWNSIIILLLTMAHGLFHHITGIIEGNE